MSYGSTVLGRVERRRRFSVEQKLQILAEASAPGANLSEVAKRHDLVPAQVFKWRRALERGELVGPCAALLPVSVSTRAQTADEATEQAPQTQAAPGGAIHIELAGRATISVERGADPVLVRSILESLGK